MMWSRRPGRRYALPHTRDPGLGTTVATRPGKSGVPRWSVEDCQNLSSQSSRRAVTD